MRFRGWARIGVLVSRLRGMLDALLEKWVEKPGSSDWPEGDRVVDIVKHLVELEGLDR